MSQSVGKLPPDESHSREMFWSMNIGPAVDVMLNSLYPDPVRDSILTESTPSVKDNTKVNVPDAATLFAQAPIICQTSPADAVATILFWDAAVKLVLIILPVFGIGPDEDNCPDNQPVLSKSSKYDLLDSVMKASSFIESKLSADIPSNTSRPLKSSKSLFVLSFIGTPGIKTQSCFNLKFTILEMLSASFMDTAPLANSFIVFA